MEIALGFLSSLFYFVILIGLLVFVHEGGHFIFAKLFGVKVHVFSLGFGPKLLGFNRGETLYKISAVPIGGYVKMLGEDPTEDLNPEDRGRSFADKPVWQRSLIIVGGPAMNLVLPLLLHFGVGLSYTEVTPAVVGFAVPGMPAYEAGMRPGDRIISIQGERIHSFDDLTSLVSPNPGKNLKIVFERNGKQLSRTIVPQAQKKTIILDVKETVGRIGVGQEYLTPVVGVFDLQGPASLAGMQTFDKIVSLDGKPVERLIDLSEMIRKKAGATVTLEVLRPKPNLAPPFGELFEKNKRTLTLVVPPEAQSLADLGLEDCTDYIVYVKPEGAAAKVGLHAGDRLLAFDGIEYQMGQVVSAIYRKRDQLGTLSWIRGDQRMEVQFKPEFIPAGEAADLGLAQDAYDKGFSLLYDALPVDKITNPTLIASAWRYAVRETGDGIHLIGLGLKLLFQSRVSLRSVGGPIMIGQLAGMAGSQGVRSFFWMTALISLNLALLNLLPIPVFDGGQLLFLGIELATRRPVNRTIKEWSMLVGLVLVVLLMVLATWNDIARLVVG